MNNFEKQLLLVQLLLQSIDDTIDWEKTKLYKQDLPYDNLKDQLENWTEEMVKILTEKKIQLYKLLKI